MSFRNVSYRLYTQASFRCHVHKHFNHLHRSPCCPLTKKKKLLSSRQNMQLFTSDCKLWIQKFNKCLRSAKHNYPCSAKRLCCKLHCASPTNYKALMKALPLARVTPPFQLDVCSLQSASSVYEGIGSSIIDNSWHGMNHTHSAIEGIQSIYRVH